MSESGVFFLIVLAIVIVSIVSINLARSRREDARKAGAAAEEDAAPTRNPIGGLTDTYSGAAAEEEDAASTGALSKEEAPPAAVKPPVYFRISKKPARVHLMRVPNLRFDHHILSVFDVNVSISRSEYEGLLKAAEFESAGAA